MERTSIYMVLMFIASFVPKISSKNRIFTYGKQTKDKLVFPRLENINIEVIYVAHTGIAD